MTAGRGREQGAGEEAEDAEGVGSQIPLGPEDEDDEFVEGVRIPNFSLQRPPLPCSPPFPSPQTYTEDSCGIIDARTA